ncbi:putative surface protein with fasciclin (FAS1) repeats [Sphingopyxis panaciterrae]|uniref:fasciclin domain-containing protein n=1 Tax=Sphingopyxis panaciterrae TaxID=363841 RepID=UPI00141E1DC1|nr:fasciclin domain-containing protein [Sphingopyxis panaciterrae]NIJ37050.1 putative surface protein with fasciclin (FAS1) repeats [Sphingopyxis panaciterrae]
MLRAKFFAVPLFALTAAAMAVPAAQARAADEGEATAAEADAAAGAMQDGWNIVQNATSSPEHKTLVQAITAAGLADTLSAAGPFTVFAPTDQAFSAVPPPMTAYLMDPLNKDHLAQVLKYHVVPGRITSTDLYAKIKAGGGKTTLTTVEGEPLTFTEVQGNIKVDGTQGSSGYVTQADVAQSNGMIHVLNGVLMPTLAAAEPAADAAPAAPATEAAPAADPVN